MKPKKELKTEYFILYIVLFFSLGLFNNLGYVLVWVSSADLSNSLEQDNLVSLYLLLMQVLSFLSRLGHMNYGIKFGYKSKLLVVSIVNIISYLTFYVVLVTTDYDDKDSLNRSFYLSLIPCILFGFSSSIGEVSLIGYMKKYPSTWMSGFSGGTGLAGVIGALIKMIFSLTDTKSSLMWLIVSISGVLYYLAYICAENLYKSDLKKQVEINLNESNILEPDQERTPEEINETTHKGSHNKVESSDTESNNSYAPQLEYEHNLSQKLTSLKIDKSREINYDEIVEDLNKTMELEEQGRENTQHKRFNWQNMKVSLKQAGSYIYNIGIAYFMSYNIVHFSERYEKFEYASTSNQYIYFNLTYQVGVLFSRSGISLIKRFKPTVLTVMIIVQTCFCAFWYVLAQVGFIKVFWPLLIIMIIVGLVEGSAYVFGFYLIYEDKKIQDEYRELSLNICFNLADICMITSSCLCLLLDNTALKV